MPDRKGRLTLDDIKEAGRLAIDMAQSQGIDKPTQDMMDAAMRTVRSADRFPDPTTLEAVEAAPGAERSFEDIQAELGAESERLNPRFPDPTTLDAVEAAPGPEKSFEEIQKLMSPRMGSMLQTSDDMELMQAMGDPVGEMPLSEAPGGFSERPHDELSLMARQAGYEISMATSELARTDLTEEESNKLRMERQQATDKLRRIRDEMDRRGGGETQEYRGGGMVGLPSYDEGGVVGRMELERDIAEARRAEARTDALEKFVKELQAEEPTDKYSFDPTTAEMAGLATLEALGDPRFTAASLALPLARPAAAMARSGLGATTKKLSEVAKYGVPDPKYHIAKKMDHIAKKMAAAGRIPAGAMQAAGTPGRQAYFFPDGPPLKPGAPPPSGASLRDLAQQAEGYTRIVQANPLKVGSAVTGSATGQHDEYGDPLGLGGRGEYQRYVSGEAPFSGFDTIIDDAKRDAASLAGRQEQRDAEELSRVLDELYDAGAPFKEYGQPAEAMGSMLARIKMKQGRGIELSPAERAALINPRAVLQTLQEYGTFTSAPAEDQINYILRESGRYREGGAVYQTLPYPKEPTETALVGEEGPELVLTPMEARKQAMQMRRAARAERILQRGEEGAERIRARGKSEIPDRQFPDSVIAPLIGPAEKPKLPRGEQPEIPDFARRETAPRDDKFSVDDFRELQTPGMGSGHMTAGDAEHYEQIKKQGGLFTGRQLLSFPPKYSYVMPGDKGYDAALKRAKMGMGFDPGPGMSKEDLEALERLLEQSRESGGPFAEGFYGQNFQEGGVVGKVVGQSGPEVRELEKGSFVLTADQTAAVNDALKRKGLTRKQRMGLNALKGK